MARNPAFSEKPGFFFGQELLIVYLPAARDSIPSSSFAYGNVRSRLVTFALCSYRRQTVDRQSPTVWRP